MNSPTANSKIDIQLKWLRTISGCSIFFFFCQIFFRQISRPINLLDLALSYFNFHLPVSFNGHFETHVFCAIAMLCALGLILGRWLALCSIVLILMNVLFFSPYLLYNWQIFVDFLFAGFIVVSFWPGYKPVFIKLTQFLGATMLVWIGWSQIGSTPWLDPMTLKHGVLISPFGRATSAFPEVARGLLPVIDILGGFVWLLELTFIFALWSPKLRRIWSVLFFIGQLILLVFTPGEFWPLAGVAATVPFLPKRLLNFEIFKKSLKANSRSNDDNQELKLEVRAVSFFLVTLMMIFTVFDRNIAEQFDVFERIGSAKIEKTYEIVTNPFVKLGNMILFNSIWKMYSPTWRHVVWIEWFAKNPDGSIVNLPQENFSPDYRRLRRSWSEAIWTDFKKEKVFVGMLSREADRITYAKYLCHLMQTQAGNVPLSIHSEINSFNIRGPNEDWSIYSQKPEKIEKDPETPCHE